MILRPRFKNFCTSTHDGHGIPQYRESSELSESMYLFIFNSPSLSYILPVENKNKEN